MIKEAVEHLDDSELIDQWKENRHKESYRELKDRHEPMVHKFKNKYGDSPVPDAALKAEAWQKFDDAVESYDEGEGAQFSTHLYNHLRGIDRYAKRHQNVGRIPEAKANRLGDLASEKADLEHELGRAPTEEEIADRLDWDEDDVEELLRINRKDLYQGGFEANEDTNDEAVTLDQQDEKVDHLLSQARDELSGREQELYDYLIGHDDKPKIQSTQKLADKFDVSSSRISQMKRSIGEEIKPHIKRRL